MCLRRSCFRWPSTGLGCSDERSSNVLLRPCLQQHPRRPSVRSCCGGDTSCCGGDTFLRRSRNRTHIQLTMAPWWLLVRPRCRGLHRIHSVASEATPPRAYLHAHVLHYKRHSTNMAPKTGSACVERAWSLSCQDPVHAHLTPLCLKEGSRSPQAQLSWLWTGE